MPIKLNGATSGSVELDVPAAVGSDLQLTLPATAGTALVAPGSTSITVPSVNGTLDRLERAGNILQVVQGGTSTGVTVSNEAYTDTNLSATITPTNSTSKILVIISQQAQYSRTNNSQGIGIRILRDSTVIHAPIENSQGGLTDYTGAVGSTAVNHYFVYNRTLLDSPNTTNAVTYKTQGRPYNDTFSGAANFQNPNTVNDGTSYIQLIEVAV